MTAKNDFGIWVCVSLLVSLTFIASCEICGSSKGSWTLFFSSATESSWKMQPREILLCNKMEVLPLGVCSCPGGSWTGKLALKCCFGITNLLSSWLCCSAVLWEKGGMWCISVHAHVCLYVKHFSVLCSFTAVISAHPIHSLDNPHHHFHSGSLASPTRSYLHHQVSPWPMGTSMSHSDRANSTGEIQTSRQILIVMEQWV